jgi:hypothetical protein
MGFLVFITGIYIIRKSKACDLSRAHDRFWYKILWFGYFSYFFTHAAWIWIAQNVAVRG